MFKPRKWVGSASSEASLLPCDSDLPHADKSQTSNSQEWIWNNWQLLDHGTIHTFHTLINHGSLCDFIVFVIYFKYFVEVTGENNSPRFPTRHRSGIADAVSDRIPSLNFSLVSSRVPHKFKQLLEQRQRTRQRSRSICHALIISVLRLGGKQRLAGAWQPEELVAACPWRQAGGQTAAGAVREGDQVCSCPAWIIPFSFWLDC